MLGQVRPLPKSSCAETTLERLKLGMNDANVTKFVP
jgi:hypothetical protein